MKLAIYSRSVPGPDGRDAFAILDSVAELGLAGCQFASPLALSSGLDASELQDVRAYAAAHRLYVELALGQINPYHFDARPDVLALGDGDMLAGLQRLVKAATGIGCTDIMFTIGTLADRFSRSVAWDEHLRATTRFLASLAPMLRDLGCRLCLKTHEEITSFEILRVVEAVGSDVVGVCFDPVNVLARIEDPLAAARRLRPYVHQLQIDDALVLMTAQGLERWLLPCGSGILNWQAILALLLPQLTESHVTIELHRAFLDMPIFDPAWLAAQPELTVDELAAVLQLVHASSSRPVVREFQTDPSTRLKPTLAYLRSLISD